MNKIIDSTKIKQKSLEWHAYKIGKIGASSIDTLLVNGRSKGSVFGKTAETYKYIILA